MKNIIIPVDIENEFCYNNSRYKVSPKLIQYEVKNYPNSDLSDNYNDWTNESEMDSVIIIDYGNKIEFLDQKGKNISKYIRQM